MDTAEDLELLNQKLNDEASLEAFAKKYDHYRVGFWPRVLGGFLVWCGNTVYGRAPSYLKFRAVEIIARVPYHSWESAAFTLLTLFYQNEERALKYAALSNFSRIAKENETMHVVVISSLAQQEDRGNIIFHSIIPLLFSFFYFWVAYWFYLISPRLALELNYVFESHAFEQYSLFVNEHKESLSKKPMHSKYLAWYGRHPENQYEFFMSVRNDEIIHRNMSIEEIEKAKS